MNPRPPSAHQPGGDIHPGTYDDIYTAESAEDWKAVFGPETAARLTATAQVVLTPDCVVSGQVGDAVQLLADLGFQAVAVHPVLMNRTVIREIWRGDVERLPPDRLAVLDLMLTFTTSVALLLTDRRPEAGVSAAARLTALKGSGIPAEREPGCLRRILYSPNSVFRLLHTSDTPARLEREMGILFDQTQRLRLLGDLQAGRTVERDAVERQTRDSLAAADLRQPGLYRLDLAGSLVSIQSAIQECRVRHSDLSNLSRVEDDLAALTLGSPPPFGVLRDALAAAEVPIDPWDLIVLGAHVVYLREAAARPDG